MGEDIVPDLLEMIEKEFGQQTLKSEKIKKALQLLQEGKATYLDANDFAIEVGEILASVFGKNITAEMLPDGKMYFNIAERILNLTLQNNYDLISGYTTDVQKQLNQQANIGLKTQVPELNQDRIDGLVNRITSKENFDEIKWILDDPVVNFCQSIVDDYIKANAEFQAKAGFNSKLRRRVSGHACDWCKSLAGIYDYYDAPDDIYRRHQRCRCTVEYNPKDGRGIQDSHSKVWTDPDKDAKIELRKTIGIKNIEANRKDFLKSRLDFIDPITLEKGFIPSGALFENTRTIFKGKEIRIVNRLADKYGGSIPKWEKRVGKIESDKYIHDVHWYENNQKQYDVKLKYRKEKKR